MVYMAQFAVAAVSGGWSGLSLLSCKPKMCELTNVVASRGASFSRVVTMGEGENLGKSGEIWTGPDRQEAV